MSTIAKKQQQKRNIALVKKNATKKTTQKKPQQKKRVKKENDSKVYKVPKPSNTVIIPTQESLYQTEVVIRPPWNPLAVQEMQAALTGYFLTRSIAASPDFQTRLPVFYNGIFTQWTEFTKIASGTPALARRLRIIHDLANAFSAKSVKKHTYAKVSFAWDNVIPPADGQYATGWNNWNFIVPDADDQSYLSPSSVHAPVVNDGDYSSYLAQVQAMSSARSHWLQVVSDSDSSPLSGDPSAFSKVYPYVGLNPSKSGGFYNDCENEVKILAPILAHNVVYPSTQDDRVAETLITNEGGPAHNLAPLVQCFNNWFNKRRFNVKFLDLYEVVYQLIYWYLGAVAQAVDEGSSPTEFQLPFSQQDFTIVVRQMILSTFKDQWMVQFTGPLAYDNGAATNFLPLQILGNCYGNDQFKRLLGPNLLAENLAMLGTCAYRYNNQSSKINETINVPCWGYYNDIPATFNIEGNEVPTPLFTVTPDQQKQISLVDCTYSSNSYVNVNGSYYMMVLEQWNNAITKLKKYVNVCDMSNMSPPKSAALTQVTRVFGYVPRQQKVTEGAKMLNFPCLAPISNLRSREVPPLVKTASKSKLPTLPPPTDVDQITIQDQYVTYPVSKEFHEFMEYMILPTVRLDPSSVNDVLNKPMYQTITYESLSQIQNGVSQAPGYLNRIKDAANMSVEGAGKIASSTITTVLRELSARGDGGVLASLLGGIAKSIVPGADGVIDAIATAMPF